MIYSSVLLFAVFSVWERRKLFRWIFKLSVIRWLFSEQFFVRFFLSNQKSAFIICKWLLIGYNNDNGNCHQAIVWMWKPNIFGMKNVVVCCLNLWKVLTISDERQCFLCAYELHCMICAAKLWILFILISIFNVNVDCYAFAIT